jgi:DNA-directed RNA polymerase subunit RPC12/RpoP
VPVYKCPKCGRTVEKPFGTYYCKVCGPSAIMVLDSRRPKYPTPEEVRERFIKGVTGSSYEGINWSEVMREFDAVWAEAEKQLRKHGYTITKEQFLKLYEPWLADILEIESFQDKVLFVVHEAVEAEEVKRLAGRWVLPRDYYEEVKRKTGKTVLEPHIKAERIAPYEAKVLERARKRFVKGVGGSNPKLSAEELEICQDFLMRLRETGQIYIVGHDVPISISRGLYIFLDELRKKMAKEKGVPEVQYEWEDLLWDLAHLKLKG